jgi:hypothetical protein
MPWRIAMVLSESLATQGKTGAPQILFSSLARPRRHGCLDHQRFGCA